MFLAGWHWSRYSFISWYFRAVLPAAGYPVVGSDPDGQRGHADCDHSWTCAGLSVGDRRVQAVARRGSTGLDCRDSLSVATQAQRSALLPPEGGPQCTGGILSCPG